MIASLQAVDEGKGIGLFNIDSIGILDVVDLILALILIFQIYKLLRGSIAFNIFIGIALLYGIWWIVRWLDMTLLKEILGAFMSIGMLIIVIVFQPEIRRFLLYVGNSTVKGRSNIIRKILPSGPQILGKKDRLIENIADACVQLARDKVGALIALSQDIHVGLYENSGVIMDAEVSARLIESIFVKDGPLHDGAMVIVKDRIYSAAAILPVSDNQEIDSQLGLRHRAALGVSEMREVLVLVVSEETGKISYAHKGVLKNIGSRPELVEVINRYYNDLQ